jgi:hypothetical protein
VTLKISPFGVLIKKIRIADYRFHCKKQAEKQEAMQAEKKVFHKTMAHHQPILPLVPPKMTAEDSKDKSKYITFELKVRSGAAAGSSTYKKSVRTFDEGSPQEWMDVLTNLKEIWKQNSINGPTDRAATIAAILKGDSLTAFEAALEDCRANPEGEDNVPAPMTTEHIETALRAVTTIIFPFRALEIQKQWMIRSMKKPYDLNTRKTAAALSRLNNYLPHFPNGNAASKFSEVELIGLLEWSLPNSWRKQMDLKGFIPSLGTRSELIEHCERIERNESNSMENGNNKNNSNKNNNKKVKFAKTENNNKKNGGDDAPAKDSSFYCRKCGHNATHDTARCFI